MDFGAYTLKDVEFQFVFDGEELTLFPKDDPHDKKIMSLTHKYIGNGTYSFPGDPIEAEDPMILFSKNHGKNLILFPISDCFNVESLLSQTISLSIGSWFRIDPDTEISGISIHSPVLDHAYDIQGAIDVATLDQNGTIQVSSGRKDGQSFDFVFDGAKINGYFSHARRVSWKSGELPIKIESRLSLNFDSTTDYIFIRKLVRLIHEFLAFIAQGYGYEYDDIELIKHYKLDDGRTCSSVCADYIESRKTEKYDSLKKVIEVDKSLNLSQKVFQSLADKQLVVEHLPSLNEKGSYNAARFIMSLAALDKTVENIYKDGIKHSEKAIESRNLINSALDELVLRSDDGRVKKDIKWLKNVLNNSESLQSRLSQLGKDHRDLFNSLRGSNYTSVQKCTALFSRITRMRNEIAHGGFNRFLECDFDDIYGINKLLLSAQLVMIGMEDDLEIASIVNSIY